jgi:hypothetical protein
MRQKQRFLVSVEGEKQVSHIDVAHCLKGLDLGSEGHVGVRELAKMRRAKPEVDGDLAEKEEDS